MYKLWFARHYQAHAPNTLLLDNALATMGAGLPSAIAAAILSPDRKVVAVCGDGGFMMNSQELETAVRLGLHLVVLILNDNGYGMILWKQSKMALPNYGLNFGNPDFVKYAEAYGAHGARAEKTEDVPGLLSHALNTPGVHLIELPVDYRENDRVLTQGLKDLVC
jgi:acetolactate synthase-1/2/3 large subunit